MTTNRHPVDELADVRAQINRLKIREQELRNEIISEECGLAGDEYEADVVVHRRETLDTGAIKREFGRERLAQFLRATDVSIVKLSRLGSGDSHEWMD